MAKCTAFLVDPMIQQRLLNPIMQEYPTTAAFSIITKVLDEFIAQEGEAWQKVEVDATTANAILEPALIKYQVKGRP